MKDFGYFFSAEREPPPYSNSVSQRVFEGSNSSGGYPTNRGYMSQAGAGGGGQGGGAVGGGRGYSGGSSSDYLGHGYNGMPTHGAHSYSSDIDLPLPTPGDDK